MGSCLPGSGEGHIETPGVVQEPNALVLVGTHTGQDDEVLLPALEGVHTGNLHLLKETMPYQPQSCLVMETIPGPGTTNIKSPELLLCHMFRTPLSFC